jgi:putative flavoprotein involved in K+ transport
MKNTQKPMGSTSSATLPTPNVMLSSKAHLLEEGAAFEQLTRDGAATATRQPEGEPERFDVIVIGAGQAGLSVGYHLARKGVSFVILDAHERIGDAWRQRWDSLRLFTPARFCGIDGWRFPASPDSFPTKDEMADYLEAYAARFQLPVRTGMRVDRLAREGDRYLVTAGGKRFESRQVVIAMATYQKPRIPEFAAGSIATSCSSIRRITAAVAAPQGGVLIVGLETPASRSPWISCGMAGRCGVGRIPGVPFRMENPRAPHHRADRVPLHLSPAAHGGHADRPQGAPRVHLQGHATDSHARE